jgi:hypothetical protein
MSWPVPVSEQMRCTLCGGLFLIADERSRLSESDAAQLRMRLGDPVCGACWVGEILADEDGRPAVEIGHA